METKVITIDGPTSSGKNSVGFLLSEKLNFQYIDSGSIYRAGCIFLLRKKIQLDEVEKLVEEFSNLQIDVKILDHKQRFIANSEDITDHLHDGQVTKIVPIIAAIREIREATRIIQHKLAQSKNIVMTGRDIGSEIFPDARHKFFLTASVEIRAKRRYEQLKKKNSSIRYEDVLEEMIERDKKDSEREVSPMRVPKDAITIDNTNLSVEETVEEMLKHINA